MYSPKLEDVRFTPWRVIDGEAISHAMIYLADDDSPLDIESTGRTFGYKVVAKVSATSTQQQRIEVLKKAQKEVVADFNVEVSGENQDFDGDYNNLKPIETSNILKLEEMQYVPTKV